MYSQSPKKVQTPVQVGIDTRFGIRFYISPPASAGEDCEKPTFYVTFNKPGQPGLYLVLSCFFIFSQTINQIQSNKVVARPTSLRREGDRPVFAVV